MIQVSHLHTSLPASHASRFVAASIMVFKEVASTSSRVRVRVRVRVRIMVFKEVASTSSRSLSFCNASNTASFP